MSRSYKKTPWSGDKKGKEKKRCLTVMISEKAFGNLMTPSRKIMYVKRLKRITQTIWRIQMLMI